MILKIFICVYLVLFLSCTIWNIITELVIKLKTKLKTKFKETFDNVVFLLRLFMTFSLFVLINKNFYLFLFIFIISCLLYLYSRREKILNIKKNFEILNNNLFFNNVKYIFLLDVFKFSYILFIIVITFFDNNVEYFNIIYIYFIYYLYFFNVFHKNFKEDLNNNLDVNIKELLNVYNNIFTVFNSIIFLIIIIFQLNNMFILFYVIFSYYFYFGMDFLCKRDDLIEKSIFVIIFCIASSLKK